MKSIKRILWCAALLCSVAGGIRGAAAQSLATPIVPNADPFITWQPVHGKYLLLATTGHDITLWSGPTVETAAKDSKVLFVSTDGLTEIWSPTIWQRGGRWWIYFTARMPGKEHAIYVLESDTKNELGSYTFRGALDLGRPAIDPSILTVKGVDYLMYVTVDRGENAVQMVELSAPMKLTGQQVLIAEPEYGWEKGEGTTRDYPVNEGPTALYHDGKTFIVFSGSDTASPRYCLGLLMLKGDDPMDRKSWVKAPKPVFTASPENGVYGPGRGTFAHAADGADWLLYAAKNTDDPTQRNRTTRGQRFTWNADGTPNFGVALQTSK